MMMEIWVDDPTMYAKRFSMGQTYFKWVPNQQLNEYICVPSEIQKYLKDQADQAGVLRVWNHKVCVPPVGGARGRQVSEEVQDEDSESAVVRYGGCWVSGNGTFAVRASWRRRVLDGSDRTEGCGGHRVLVDESSLADQGSRCGRDGQDAGMDSGDGQHAVDGTAWFQQEYR